MKCWTRSVRSRCCECGHTTSSSRPAAASVLVKRAGRHVGQLADQPESGRRPQELRRSRYRQIVEPPCRIFYRFDGEKVFVLHVMRTERLLRKGRLATRVQQAKV
ncbi:type II toxin-antitoxin system RelE/ParE family toxin [Marilutibacter aestuarii]|uniref:Type II toxin-antitoxin system RelE/ParE family toxin n=1 Tax=Marilutibacter aestuarii TaxID=1706195 RepID=A0A508APU6_9GAMM|nr:type II toxin-antitoxin system RelE/ParE family toxin [Lysobacter aestuarii]TQD49758.1 type II toxin-antitoxin system RelE/ParE family toxin [Lysobacter aestuarii]